MPTRNPRAQAAQLLAQVQQGRSLTSLLQNLEHPEKPFIQALCFDVLRHYFLLEHIVQQLLHKPIAKKDQDIYALLLLGLQQLQDGVTKPYVAINETVAAAQALKKTSSKSLVNAVLRNFQRKKDECLANLNPEAQYECPSWLLEQLQNDWPDNWQAICAAQHLAPPMTLRINLQQQSRENYLNLLQQQGVSAQALQASSAIQLEQACKVTELPGFTEAAVSVQDQAGQFIAEILTLKPGMRVLDACSAPGSKLAHLFEVCPQAHFTAVELDAQRAQRLQDTIARHNITAQIYIADASDPQTWWDEQAFDLILLDAPCSATGVIRRHPDIKLLRRAEDIAALADTQTQLLQTLRPLLKPGGQLLYTSCSILKQENDAMIAACLPELAGLKAQALSLPIGRKTEYGWQILPGEQTCDGFYYCLLK